MKKYRVLYWVGAIYTDCFIFANNEENCIKKFKFTKGKHLKIISIEEITC